MSPSSLTQNPAPSEYAGPVRQREPALPGPHTPPPRLPPPVLEPLDGHELPLPTGLSEDDEPVVVVDDESGSPASGPEPEIRPRALLAGRRPGSTLRKAVDPTLVA